MKKVVAIVIAVVFVAWGVLYWMSAQNTLSLAQALKIAQSPSSECIQKGSVGMSGTYNPNSRTWWIDFTPSARYAQSGCNPTCVVSATSRTSEINWRCTGLLPASSSPSSR